jgi:two-component system phosphate regulon sensor histidine kinase PhoR
MKLNKLRLIIIAISVACIGLLAIQYYWIKTAYLLQEDALKQSIQQSLRLAANEVEKEDILREFKFFSPDTSETMELIVNMISADSQVTQTVQRINKTRAFAYTNNGKRQLVTESTNKQGNKKQPSYSFNYSYSLSDDSVITQQRFTHSGSRLDTSILKRFPPPQLDAKSQIEEINEENWTVAAPTIIDSINKLRHNIQGLRFRFNNDGIKRTVNLNRVDSVFAVLIKEKEELIQAEDFKLSLIDTVPSLPLQARSGELTLVARLFPNDLSETSSYLQFTMANNSFVILKKLVLQIILSLFFMAIVISCFTIAVRTILKQRKLSELKNDFINNMTHELKTPISSIALAAEGLSQPQKAADTDRVIQYANIISSENKRLSTHVNNILQMAAIERDQLDLEKQMLNLHELAMQSAKRFELSVEAVQGDIQFELHASNDQIQGDRLHMSNILANLIDNAVKYAADSLRVTIRTWNEDEHICLAVEDNGIGMNKEQLRHVFEKFYRAQTGNIHTVKGFGLGLAYVQAMVIEHAGTIEIASELAKGTTVTIKLPLAF